jgi:trehalose 6-phosphate phosphatase
MQNVLYLWREVARRIRASRRVLLLCDYDGTLAPIVDRPELAELSKKARQLLQFLNAQRKFTVGIISGRGLDDLKERVAIDNIIYAGNHGLEIEGSAVNFINPLAEEVRPVFSLISQVLSKAFQHIKGVLVEDKGLTLSVHYRMVPEEKLDDVKTVFENVISLAQSLKQVKVTLGKRVYEIRPPVDWDKGKAIDLLIVRLNNIAGDASTLPIFLGDDQTDEDGFKVINRYRGIPIFVGSEPGDTVARYYLSSPQEVEEFLNLLGSDV